MNKCGLCLLSFILCLLLCSGETSTCGGHTQSHYGTITSPGFPGVYPASQNCTWTIEGPSDSIILITFQYFYLYYRDNRCYAYLMIEQKMYCSWHVRGTTVVVQNNTGRLVFISSSRRNNYAGFNITWRAIMRPRLESTPLSWKDATQTCIDTGDNILSDEEAVRGMRTNIVQQMEAINVTEVWYGKYFVPWTWLKGCFADFDVTTTELTAVFKNNQLKMCSSVCSSFNFFALQRTTCICFDDFYGKLVQSAKCESRCPGNHDERCGGTASWTVYMNDLCYTNSTSWGGTVSRINNDEHCMNWVERLKQIGDVDAGRYRNYSNYCRDPNGTGRLWCYSESGNKSHCSVPKCLKKLETLGMRNCLELRSLGNGTFKMLQRYCFNRRPVFSYKNLTIRSITEKQFTWTEGREQVDYMADFQILGLSLSDIGNFWTSISRNETHNGITEPTHAPEDCFKLVKKGTRVTAKATKCSEHLPSLCVKDVVTCGAALNSSNGSITSPQYDVNMNCVWTIHAHQPITLTIEFDIEESFKCECDSLRVYFNEAVRGLPNKTFCGLGQAVVSAGPVVTVMYRTDKTVHSLGFNLTWEEEYESITNNTKTTSIDDLSDNNVAAIVGSICGALVAMVIVSLAIVFMCRRRNVTSSETKIRCGTDIPASEQKGGRGGTYKEKKQNYTIVSDALQCDAFVSTQCAEVGIASRHDNSSLDAKTENQTIANTGKEITRTSPIKPKRKSGKTVQTEVSRDEITLDHLSKDNYNCLNEKHERVYVNRVDNVYNHLADAVDSTYSHANMPSVHLVCNTKGNDNLYNHLNNQTTTQDNINTRNSNRINPSKHNTDTEDTYSHANLGNTKGDEHIGGTDNVYNRLSRGPVFIAGDDEVYYNETAIQRQKQENDCVDTYSHVQR